MVSSSQKGVAKRSVYFHSDTSKLLGEDVATRLIFMSSKEVLKEVYIFLQTRQSYLGKTLQLAYIHVVQRR